MFVNFSSIYVDMFICDHGGANYFDYYIDDDIVDVSVKRLSVSC